MKIKAYISFPVHDDYFISVGGNIDLYKELINEVVIILKLLKKKDYELWFDSENLRLFFSKIAMVNTEPYLGNLNLQLKSYLDKKVQDVRTSPISSGQFRYIIIYCKTEIIDAPLIVSEAIESEITKRVNEHCVFINFRNSIPSERDNLFCVKDALHIHDLPILKSIQLASCDKEFAEWYSSNTNQNFSVRDKTQFQPTSYMWEKQRIYKKLSDGTLWYFDYFHRENKMHFEVFNNTGKVHLGEANTDGNIDYQKADKNKKIDNRIQ